MPRFYKILLTILYFTIALPINAKVYACEVNGKTIFTDQICEYEEQVEVKEHAQDKSKKVLNKKYPKDPKYISFQFGGSACPEKKYWENFIDNIATYDMKEFDKHCLYLREGNIVYGFLKRVSYKNTELVQVESSDGRLLWLEFAGVKKVVSSTNQKPEQWTTTLRIQNGQIVSNKMPVNEYVSEALEVMEQVFIGGYSKRTIKTRLDRAMKLYKTPLTEGNYHKCASALVGIRKSSGFSEMALLKYMIAMHTPSANLNFPSGLAFASVLME